MSNCILPQSFLMGTSHQPHFVLLYRRPKSTPPTPTSPTLTEIEEIMVHWTEGNPGATLICGGWVVGCNKPATHIKLGGSMCHPKCKAHSTYRDEVIPERSLRNSGHPPPHPHTRTQCIFNATPTIRPIGYTTHPEVSQQTGSVQNHI